LGRCQKLRRSEILLGSISIAFLFLIVACGGDTPSPAVSAKAKSFPEKKAAETMKVEEKKESAKKEEASEYSYNPTGKADPFSPFIKLSSARESRNVALTPLQKYDISQLKLVAIIASPEGNIALVEDALGKGYFLKKGTGVGKNDGKVVKILKDRVIIEESYRDILGQPKTNEISLVLHRVEEGGES